MLMGVEQAKVIDTGYRPNVLQQSIHRSMRRYNVLVCHRRFGKTVLAINALVDAALRNTLRNPRYAYVAPLRKQVKKVAWDYLKQYTAQIPGVRSNETELWVELPTGARIFLEGADEPDSLRGIYLDGIVMDEVAQMRPSLWGEVVRPTLSDRKGWVIFIGTPKGINQFYDLYHNNLSNPDWFVKKFPIAETLPYLPWLDEEEISEARAAVTEAQARQEWDCDFNASSDDTLISVDLATAASGKHLRVDQYSFAPMILGVDVARFGDDSSVIVPRQGLAMFPPQVYKKLDNMEFADKVIVAINKYKADAVFVDGGRGEGVIDFCRRMGYPVTEVAFGGKARDTAHYHDRRSEMWCEMEAWLRSGGALPVDSGLVADLVMPTFAYDESGRRHLASKKKLKELFGRSPDVGDAAALTFAVPIKMKEGLAFGLNRATGTSKRTVSRTNDDYNPF